MPEPIMKVYHEDGRWRVESDALPDMRCSSVTLWSLLNTLRDRVTVTIERTIRDLQDQGRI